MTLTSCDTPASDEEPAASPAALNEQPAYPACRLTFIEETRIGVLGSPPEQSFGHLTSFAADRDGRMFLLDPPMGAIHVFAPNGDHRVTFGGLGDSPREFRAPQRIAVAAGKIFVLDAMRLVAFDTSGRYVNQGRLDFQPGGLSYLAADDRFVYLTGRDHDGPLTGPVVHVFSHELEPVHAFGRIESRQDERSAVLMGSARVAPVGDSVWFLPLFDYSLQLFTATGRFIRAVHRTNSLSFNDEPFVEETSEGAFSSVSFNMKRAFVVGLSVSPRSGVVWTFVRDNISRLVTIDAFDPTGVWLASTEFDADLIIPAHIGPDGHGYRLTTDLGYPQLVRYRVEARPDSACPSADQLTGRESSGQSHGVDRKQFN